MSESIGLDVSKRELVGATHLSAESARFANDSAGHAALIAWCAPRAPERIVLESTSTYHLPVLLALAEAGLPVIVANPQRVRAFARSLGRLAKTDALDARQLARFAALAQPTVRPIPSAADLELKALVARRRQLKEAIVRQRNQREAAPAALHAVWFDPLIDQHTQVLRALEADLGARVAANADWAAKITILCSVPGVGFITAATLLADLPELGHATHREVAALAGLAPHERQSGDTRRPAPIGGGRPEVRTALYLPALAAWRCNSVIRAFADGLSARQKAKKVVIVACMHKLLTFLNALLRDGALWNPVLTP